MKGGSSCADSSGLCGSLRHPLGLLRLEGDINVLGMLEPGALRDGLGHSHTRLAGNLEGKDSMRLLKWRHKRHLRLMRAKPPSWQCQWFELLAGLTDCCNGNTIRPCDMVDEGQSACRSTCPLLHTMNDPTHGGHTNMCCCLRNSEALLQSKPSNLTSCTILQTSSYSLARWVSSRISGLPGVRALVLSTLNTTGPCKHQIRTQHASKPMERKVLPISAGLRRSVPKNTVSSLKEEGYSPSHAWHHGRHHTAF